MKYLLLLVLLSGCYRLPTEDDYSVIPLINNRDITREKSNPIPQMGVQ